MLPWGWFNGLLGLLQRVRISSSGRVEFVDIALDSGASQSSHRINELVPSDPCIRFFLHFEKDTLSFSHTYMPLDEFTKAITV